MVEFALILPVLLILLSLAEQPRHLQADVLEHVVGVKGAHESAQITMQRRLDASKQEFQRIAVTALCSQDP